MKEIKARMFVVNEHTYRKSKESGIVSVRIPLNKKNIDHKAPSTQFVSSTNSMLADILQIEKGDYIFFWCEKNQDSYKSNIIGVYRVISDPYYKFDDNDDIAPFKIKIEEAYHFEKAITEYDLLNSPYIKENLWNIIGKKVCGKSRGTIQITKPEIKVLIDLLIGMNPNYTFIPQDESRFIDLPCTLSSGEELPQPLKFNYHTGKKLQKPEIDKLYTYNMYNYNHFNESGKLYDEKSFEAMFNFELKNRNSAFFNQIGINPDKVIWFANYLPYSLDQTEMDYFIIESEDGISYSKVYVIEFKKGMLPLDNDSHFYRAMLYSKWINDNLLNGASNTTPIVICEECPDFADPKSEEEQNFISKYNDREKESGFKVNNVKIYTITLSSDSIVFTKKR
ncbi:MAG: EVE domain-containing protein [Bacilli bacterium]